MNLVGRTPFRRVYAQLRDEARKSATTWPLIRALVGSKAKAEEQLRAAHAQSEGADWAFESFRRELDACLAARASRLDFDEAFYLRANPDVAAEVQRGRLHSGYVHFCLSGKREGRLFSTQALSRKLGLRPRFPESELTRPVHFHPPPRYGPDLSRLPRASAPHLLILVPYLRRELFFAGYSSFFDEVATLFSRFPQVTVVVLMEGMEPSGYRTS
jgi:hypothetical protein